ncbi:MAG: hypothetical protein ABSF77_13900 [Spirochaetia bacterium]|jgi:hypothetical protein
MKKILFLVLVVLLASATGAFAAKGSGLAIGGEGSLYFGGSGGMPMGAMLTLHLPKFPMMLGIGIDSSLDIGVTADYWVARGNLASIFGWYVGVGGYLTLYSSPFDLALGGRIPIALQAWPFGQSFEIFLEVAPAVGFSLIPTGFDWHIQSALGFRFWF